MIDLQFIGERSGKHTCKDKSPSRMSLIYKELDEQLAKRMNAYFPQRHNWLIDVQPGNIILPRAYAEIGESIRALPTYKDDLWLVAYPGTDAANMQELIWLLNNNLDFKQAKRRKLYKRVPMLESFGDAINVVSSMSRPRFSYSELPWNLLPQQFDAVKPRIIYVARHPKDLCISLYLHYRCRHGLSSTFENFVELFLEDSLPGGSFWRHVLPFWKRSQDPNILFLKYAQIERNLPSIVHKCAKFLDVDQLISRNVLRSICEQLKIADEGHRRDFTDRFEISDMRQILTNEKISQSFDNWMDCNVKGSGLVFEL